MSDLPRESDPGSGAMPHAWMQMRLDAFPAYLGAHYPELAAVFERVGALGQPEMEPHVVTANPTEGKLADGAFDAIHEDLRAGVRCVLEDLNSGWTEGQTFMIHNALMRAFILGLWLGEFGLARVERSQP